MPQLTLMEEKTRLSRMPMAIYVMFRLTLNFWRIINRFIKPGWLIGWVTNSHLMDVNAKYLISGISLEYEVVTNAELARMIKNQYSGMMTVLYDRVLRHRVIPLNRTDKMWNINFNTPAKSMKRILLLFRKSDAMSSSKCYDPKIDKISINIEGVPNQLYAQGMRRYQHWEEI